MKKFDELMDEAKSMGVEDAKNAATMVVDENTSQETIRALLKGIDDGDPEVLDGFRAPDLSGEFADDLTPQRLFENLTGCEAGYDGSDAEQVDAFATAYETGVSETFQSAVEQELLKWLDESDPENDDEPVGVKILKSERGRAAENARDAIKKLRRELDWMEAAVLAAANGEPVRTMDLTPSHQTMAEVSAYGVELRTLWNAVGHASR